VSLVTRHLSRVVRALAVFAVLILVAAACGDSDSRAEGSHTVTLYSGRSEDLIAPLIEQYEAAAGVNVEVRYGANAELALLIETEGDKSPADVFLASSPGAVGFLAERDLLQPLSDDVLDQAPSSPRGLWVAVSGRQRVLVYDSSDLAEDDLPLLIADVAKPEFLGRVAVAPGNGSFQDFVTLMRLEIGDDATLEWLTALADGGAPTMSNNSGIVQAVARGEVEMGLVNHYYNLRLLAEDPGAFSRNHVFAEGDPGAVMIVTAASLVAGGNAEAGEALISFLLTEDSQRYYADETQEYPLAGSVGGDAALQPPGAIDTGAFDALGSGLERTLELIREAGFDV
jgi:iron(III) transport system substrate-binding protein